MHVIAATQERRRIKIQGQPEKRETLPEKLLM
jgi:hypothetical protein